MLKKTIALFVLALALVSTAPVASADVDIPECYPCGPK